MGNNETICAMALRILIIIILLGCNSSTHTDAITDSRTDTYEVVSVNHHYHKYSGSIYVDLLRDSDHVLYKDVFVAGVGNDLDCKSLVIKGAYIRAKINTYNEFGKTWHAFDQGYLERCLCNGDCSGNK